MNSSNKINIIFDTNIFYKSGKNGYSFSEFKLNSRFDNIIGFLEEKDLYEHVTLVLPKIVLTELKKQQLDKFYSELDEFRKKAKQFEGIFDLNEIDKEIPYEDLLEQYYTKFEDYIKNAMVKIDILDFPSSNRFKNLINRAINKQAPFEGGEKKSDKGFKDALLWESILEYAEKNSGDYILYCQDARLEEATKEFSKIFNNDMEVLKNEKELREKIISYFLHDISDNKINEDIITRISEKLKEPEYLRIYIENELYTKKYEIENKKIYEEYIIDNININSIIDGRANDGEKDIYTFIFEFEGELEYSERGSGEVHFDNCKGEIIIEKPIKEETFYPTRMNVNNNIYEFGKLMEEYNGI